MAISAGQLGGMLGDPNQTAQGLASGGLAQLFRSGPGVRRTDKLGLAMRFQVTIGDVKLGLWRSCRGLRADFKPEVVRVTGDYVGQYHLPGEVSYPPVVLERAVHREHSAQLQQWLVGVLRSWQDGTGDDTRTTARITLLDADGEPVNSWLLYGVRPSSWTGPDLAADTNQVAVERLELVHEGFFPDLQARAETAELSEPTIGTVSFAYNPAKMTITRSSRPSQLIGQGRGVVLASDDALRVMAGEVLLVGAGVAGDVQKLIAFSGQQAGNGGGGPDARQDVLPKLTFTWGKLSMTVNLSTLNVNLTRFDGQGQPVRAQATLDLVVIEGEIFPRTPGAPVPPRTVRTDPAQWRQRAAASGIDDPMRAQARGASVGARR
ncbi:phage tail protein [Micromonospora cathayae]|uniref:Phage tail protein n=1 Tax=Micromonospora cathayae TaxID=3028804 RepID=A0ABY7ZVE3_9ACTN|nr:phage tail protein [Micromonospora sp. HUAS 3]WDZ87021.1 phage tail protein [Micromonospora sp. HUAS 3]